MGVFLGDLGGVWKFKETLSLGFVISFSSKRDPRGKIKIKLQDYILIRIYSLIKFAGR